MDYAFLPGETTRRAIGPPVRPNPMPDDGYPAVIADQRHFFRCETREQIETAWLDNLATKRLDPWFDETLEAVPYINRARWLIDCPSCNAGNFAWDGNPLACCLDCGLIVKVAWQPPTVRSAAVRLLAVRPVENCNWDAHKGETIERLETENLLLLGEPTTVKDGMRLPVGLAVPEFTTDLRLA